MKLRTALVKVHAEGGDVAEGTATRRNRTRWQPEGDAFAG